MCVGQLILPPPPARTTGLSPLLSLDLSLCTKMSTRLDPVCARKCPQDGESGSRVGRKHSPKHPLPCQNHRPCSLVYACFIFRRSCHQKPPSHLHGPLVVQPTHPPVTNTPPTTPCDVPFDSPTSPGQYYHKTSEPQPPY